MDKPFDGKLLSSNLLWYSLFFNFIQFAIWENLSILDLALSGVNRSIHINAFMARSLCSKYSLRQMLPKLDLSTFSVVDNVQKYQYSFHFLSYIPMI